MVAQSRPTGSGKETFCALPLPKLGSQTTKLRRLNFSAVMQWCLFFMHRGPASRSISRLPLIALRTLAATKYNIQLANISMHGMVSKPGC